MLISPFHVEVIRQDMAECKDNAHCLEESYVMAQMGKLADLNREGSSTSVKQDIRGVLANSSCNVMGRVRLCTTPAKCPSLSKVSVSHNHSSPEGFSAVMLFCSYGCCSSSWLTQSNSHKLKKKKFSAYYFHQSPTN